MQQKKNFVYLASFGFIFLMMISYHSGYSFQKEKKLYGAAQIASARSEIVTGQAVLSTLNDSAVWQSYPLFGGEILSIVQNPKTLNTIYIGTRDAGVFKSIDGGETWQPARTGLTFFPIRSLAIDPQTPGTLYAGTDFDGIWKTIDGGNSWFKSSQGLKENMVVFDIVIHPRQSEVVYAAQGGGVAMVIGHIYKSIDGGNTWKLQENGIKRNQDGNYINAVFDLALHPEQPDTLLAGTNYDGIFRTYDGGDNWTAVNDSVPYLSYPDWHNTICSLEFNPYADYRAYAVIKNGFYRLSDNDVWEKQTSGAFHQVGGEDAHLYFPASDSLYVLCASGFFGLTESRDGGKHWEQLYPAISEIVVMPSVSISFYGIHAVTFDSIGGVYQSRDQGKNWVRKSNGITALNIQSVAISPHDSTHIMAGTGAGFLFYSWDAGETWQRAFYRNWSPDYNFGDIHTILFDPIEPNRIYVAAFGGFFRSTNGGVEFEQMESIDTPKCLAIDNQGTLYAGVSGFSSGVMKSEDHGQTWFPKNTGLTDEYGMGIAVFCLAIDPTNPSRIWAGTWHGHGLFRSDNGGDSWQKQNFADENTIDAISINPSNSQELLVGASALDGRIYRSTDGGETWHIRMDKMAAVQTFAYDPRNANFVYAGTEGFGVLRSTDGGHSWAFYNEGLFYPLVYSMGFSGTREPVLIAGTYGAGLLWARPTLDGPTLVPTPPLPQETCHLTSNYPNPFNPQTTIEFHLSQQSPVQLTVYNVQGQAVTTLVQGVLDAGLHRVRFAGQELPSGTYFCRLKVGEKVLTRKMILLR